MERFEFKMCDIKYPIYYVMGINESAKYLCNQKNDYIMIVYDKSLSLETINELADKVSTKKRCETMAVDINETNKNLATVDEIATKMIERNVNRSTLIVAIGGGVLGNIVGLVAGLIFRGIKFIHVPTTIVAATDSVLSIKQAVNLKYGKNLVGMYYSQDSVLICYEFFKTIPKREYYSGLAETVKNLLSIIPEDIDEFKEKMVNTDYSSKELLYLLKLSIKAKQKVLINDKYERKSGLVLEYGHTIGHAIEVVSKGNIRHGEAIAFGMMVASEISNKYGMLSNSEVNMHYELLSMIGMLEPTMQISKYNMDDIIEIMKYDNKREYYRYGKNIPLVILSKLGTCYSSNNCFFLEVSEEIIREKAAVVHSKIEKIYFHQYDVYKEFNFLDKIRQNHEWPTKVYD